MGGSHAACRSLDGRRRGRAGRHVVIRLLFAAGYLDRNGCGARQQPRSRTASSLVRPANQTRRDSATGAFAAIAMGLRPLELERSAICMDAGALYRTPEARRQLAPRLLATGGRRLGVGRRPLAL